MNISSTNTEDIPDVAPVVSDLSSFDSLDNNAQGGGGPSRGIQKYNKDFKSTSSQCQTHVIPIEDDTDNDSNPTQEAEPNGEIVPVSYSSILLSPQDERDQASSISIVEVDDDDLIGSLNSLRLNDEGESKSTDDDLLLRRKRMNQKHQQLQLLCQIPELVRTVSIETNRKEPDDDDEIISADHEYEHMIAPDDEDLRRQVGSNDYERQNNARDGVVIEYYEDDLRRQVGSNDYDRNDIRDCPDVDYEDDLRRQVGSNDYDRNDVRDGPDSDHDDDINEREAIRGFYFDQMSEVVPVGSCK